MVGENLLRFNKEQKYVIFDGETCSLNLLSPDNKCWNWAWMVCTIDRVISRHNHFVNWDDLNVLPEAAAITGFSKELIEEKGKEPEYVLNELDKYLYDDQYKLVAHNGLGFDVYIHNIHRHLLGRPTDYSYIPRMLDTNALMKAYKLGAKPSKGEDLIAFQYRYNNFHAKGIKTNIKHLCGELKIPYVESTAHRADYDVEVLYAIFKQVLFKLEI